MSAEFIRASAGSGKTYQLSGRYLGILLRGLRAGQPVDPGKILATTFTRAAAGEILQRVLLRLSLAALDAGERTRLGQSAHCDLLTAEECRQALAHLAQNLHRVQIGTIDSFFARIARSMPEDLGLPVGWQVVSSVEAERLSLQAVESLMTGDQAEQVMRLWHIYQSYALRLKIAEPLQAALEAARFHLLPTHDDPFHGEPRRLRPGEVEALQRLIRAVPELCNKDGSPTKAHLNAKEALLTSLAPGVRLDRLLINSSYSSLLRRLYHREEYSPTGRRHYPEELQGALEPFVQELRTVMDRLRRDGETALQRLSVLYRETYETLALRQGWLTFRDVEESVRRGIRHDDGTALSDLYFRLDSRIEHLLFDEFQDTSWSQMDFFDPLIREFLSQGQHVIVVGDPKQAIYGWRGGDRAVIDTFSDRFSLATENQTFLTTSFRSSPVVLEAVDQVFQSLPKFLPDQDLTSPLQQSVDQWLVGYRAHQSAEAVSLLPGRVRMIETEPTAPEPETALMTTIVQSVREHAAAGREVAILTRRKKFIPRILAELRREGLAAAGDGGSTLTDSLAVEILLAGLTWLEHPGHTMARELAACAPWARELAAELQSSASLLRQTRLQWRQLWHDQGAASLLTQWVTELLPKLGAHDAQRAGQLRDLAVKFDLTGAHQIDDFTQWARQELVRAVQHCPIRVMTIHASKGLEFPAVILTDLDQTTQRGSSEVPRFVVEHDGLNVVSRLIPNSTLLGAPELREREKVQLFMEQLSVLYVGMTRAQTHLDLILTGSKPAASSSGPKESMAAILRGTLGPGYDRSFAPVQPSDPVPPPARIVSQDSVFTLTLPNLVMPSARPPRRETRSPSGEEGSGGPRPVHHLFRARSDRALSRGTLLHAWLAQIEWLDGSDPDEATDEFTRIREQWPDWDEQELRSEWNTFRRRLRDPDLWPWFSEESYQERWSPGPLEVWRERRFVSLLQGEPWSGAFDRVVLRRSPNQTPTHVEVLDFKTDLVATPEDRQTRELHYAPQLTAYQLILAERFPAAQVSAHLVFI